MKKRKLLFFLIKLDIEFANLQICGIFIKLVLFTLRNSLYLNIY